MIKWIQDRRPREGRVRSCISAGFEMESGYFRGLKWSIEDASGLTDQERLGMRDGYNLSLDSFGGNDNED
ncbi:MAG: hypothetical protein HOC28_02535 [Bacteroidetes Order II. Incertae sedis bacterium]|jgi:hypothetical protein|nr:hypothetical protein [Bacteroidetes Order II. bacterium]MBT4052679.1 hypothetical protein [Bacteroidetes Order II. bacterium]MBT4601990.1 hypothetical protein [Bacteroidetes Order II. bacterium]MBT5250087.1 hypothetical protein [Bacteroidetes Order II. bacterium]MBT6201814.1 hypothetical protein [Bacteroidetes Order II. bacterium]